MQLVKGFIAKRSLLWLRRLRLISPGDSDIVLTENIDSQLHRRFRSTWAGCLAGAILEESYWQIMGHAGFTDIQIVSRHTLTPMELKAMACCPGEEFTPPPNKKDLEIVQEKVGSVKFTAIKPPSA
jgi:hypothetical protein